MEAGASDFLRNEISSRVRARGYSAFTRARAWLLISRCPATRMVWKSFETMIRAVDHRECLFTTAIVNPKQPIPGVPANTNQVFHTCSCFYRDGADRKDHLVALLCGYGRGWRSRPAERAGRGILYWSSLQRAAGYSNSTVAVAQPIIVER